MKTFEKKTDSVKTPKGGLFVPKGGLLYHIFSGIRGNYQKRDSKGGYASDLMLEVCKKWQIQSEVCALEKKETSYLP